MSTGSRSGAPESDGGAPPATRSGAMGRVREALGASMPDVCSLLEARSERRHVVADVIGKGGMGEVCRLRDLALVRDVAMKSTHPASPAGAAVHLLSEARITGQLDHPHIVPVHDVGLGPDGSSVYFTMKLVQGRTLTKVIEEMHGAPWDDLAIERCLQVILKVCDALAFCHERGVVHRDLKPDNIMVGSFGQVYLMDWGLALRVPTAGTGDEEAMSSRAAPVSDSDREIAGTPAYMAPEQLWGRTHLIDRRTDVFGVGGLLYHLLTGLGPNMKTGPRRPAYPPSIVPSEDRGAWPILPPELCRITTKALAYDPEGRYATVLDLQADLEQFLRGGGWFSTRRLPAGSAIVRQGDPAAEAYMIVEGTCEVTKSTDGDTSFLLRRLGPGDVFGETAILTGAPRTATVVAVTDVTLKVVTADAFERELGRHSWVGTFVRAVAARFREADDQLASFRGAT
jgi:eukaryotic-like serine/threonine-protein kinase